MWNIDKLYTRRNMCIKIEKKQHMSDKCEENIHHLIYTSLSPPSEEEDSLTNSGEGEGAKPSSRDWWWAMQPILVFIWHISSNRWSRQLPKLARMCWSYSMMSIRERVAWEEQEEAEDEEGKEEGATGSAGAVLEGSTHSFVASYAALCRIDPLLMAPMT